MNRVVVFTKNNARIFTNPTPSELEFFKTIPTAVIDPDLEHLKGYGPELWKLKDGKIIIKNPMEIQLTHESHKRDGVVNDLPKPEFVNPAIQYGRYVYFQIQIMWSYWYSKVFVGFVLGYLVSRFK